jgi:hypothetical protein
MNKYYKIDILEKKKGFFVIRLKCYWLLLKNVLLI